MYNNGAYEAIRYYNSLITDDLAKADQDMEWLYAQQKEYKATFGGRPLSHSLRPTFLTEQAYNQIQDVVYLIRQAVLDIARHHMNTTEVMAELGMQDWEIELAAIPTNVIRMSATARFDAFMTVDNFKFVEINAESPAGIGYCAEMAKIYQNSRIMKDFVKKYPVRFINPLEHLIHGLLRTYHEEFEGKEERPTFAIVDFLDVPTYNEFLIIQEYLERLGYPCEICDPRKLELKDGWLYANGKKIDILYRRLLTNEFWEIKDDCPALLEGYKQQKTCFLNSFRSKMVHKKAIFSLLTDPKYTRVLNNLQLQAIREHIPWTRRLGFKTTNYKGKMVDLLEMVRDNKDQFVIKPNDEYGGKGVFLGQDVTQSTWESALDTGIKEGFVVQEIVNIHREGFINRVNGNWENVPTVVDLDPYINGPMVGGCLTRTSASNLANVTAGGGSLPMFILRYA
ncbi:hypothetical protein EP331_15570 [bacterium]|nr:MAG: hypothetical protein EP331_15570 [bacterium]